MTLRLNSATCEGFRDCLPGCVALLGLALGAATEPLHGVPAWVLYVFLWAGTALIVVPKRSARGVPLRKPRPTSQRLSSWRSSRGQTRATASRARPLTRSPVTVAHP